MKKRLKIRGLGWVMVMALGACGTVNKMKEEERVERSLEFGERLVLNEDMRFGSRWLSGAWSTGSDLVTAVIESDSVIAFDPSAGFELSGGRVLYQRAAQESSSELAANRQVVANSRDSLVEWDIKAETEVKAVSVDKEREGTGQWFWGVVIMLVMVALVRIIIMRLKFNK